MIYRIARKYGVTYYAALFEEALFDQLPWGNRLFDCFIFPPRGKSHSRMERLLDVLPYARVDWVFTAEPRSEYWHDRVDHKSVEKGVQEKVGDGHPMTAWFEEIKTPGDWDTSYNHGGSDHFLFIFLDCSEPMTKRVDALRKKIRAG